MARSQHGCIIFNPTAGTAENLEQLKGQLNGFELLDSDSPRKTRALAARYGQRVEVVIAAGGDGTIHHVVNGLMTGSARAALGILPWGTGNDLARTLGIPADDPNAALHHILRGRTRVLDLVRVTMGRRKLWCINVAAGGFTGQMNEVMTDEMKKTWGPLAYLRGALKVLPDLTQYRTTLRHDYTQMRRISALSIIVANGQTAGGGMNIAPQADPSDGWLDLVVVESGTRLELTGVAARLLTGNYLKSGRVWHRKVKRVAIHSKPGMWFNVDGELIGKEPVSFEIVPGALRVIAGGRRRR